MPFLGIGGRGQTEVIHRGERTNPGVIIGQGLALIAVALVAFGVVRTYLYYWDWITKNEAHSWLGPMSIILILGCIVVGIVLFQEIFDPNWPNPRQATESTKPLFPWSKERQKPEGDKTVINLGWKWEGLLDAIGLMIVEEDDEEDEDDE